MPGHRVYCLRCFATLAERKRASTRCDHCGYLNVAADRRVYWNRTPRLCFVERTLKIVVGLSTLLTCFLVAAVFPSGIAGGYAMASPLIPGIMLWYTVSKLTRHMPYFRPVAVWCAIICAGVACILLVYGSSIPSSRGVAVLGAMVMLCGLVHTTARWLHRWKMHLTGRRAWGS